MRLIKFLFASTVALCLILAGYYFVWNLMANTRQHEIQTRFDESTKFDFDHKGANVSGYPNNININYSDLTFKSKKSNNSIEYTVGDVLFKIYPFVLKQQAEIILQKNQYFTLNYDGVEREFKLQTSKIDVRFLDNQINLDLTDVKVFEVTSNKLLLKADKIYYSSKMDKTDEFTFNVKQLEMRHKKVDSILLNLSLKNINKLDMFAIILNMLILEDSKLDAYFNDNIKFINKRNATIDIKSMKVVDSDKWFELISPLKVDTRGRLYGKIEIVSNNINTAEDILKVLSSNEDINVSEIELIRRLISKNNNNLIRLSGKMERGFLEIFNEKIARVKPQSY